MSEPREPISKKGAGEEGVGRVLDANRSTARWIGLVSMTLILILVRDLLIRTGLVYGDDNVRLLTASLGGLILVLAVLLLGDIRRLVALVAAVVALVGALELVRPYAPDTPTAGSCEGAQIQNVAFLATTHSGGVNVRAGPGRSFEQAGRFQGDCSLGFEGYCLGEPALDFFALPKYEVPDIRWLRLPDDRGYVAAGVVKPQEAQRELTRLSDCPRVWPSFGVLNLASPSSATEIRGETTLTAQVEGALVVGFAAHWKDPNGLSFFDRIALDGSAEDGFSAVWDTEMQRTGAGRGRGEVLVAAVACYAAEAPSRTVDDATFLLANGQDSGGREASLEPYSDLPIEARERLRQAACLLPE